MAADNYIMNLKLTGFNGAKIVSLENDEGIEEEGVFIPFHLNGVSIDEKTHNAYVKCFVNEWVGNNSFKGQSHNIRLKLPYDVLRETQDLGYNVAKLGSLSRYYQMSEFQKSYNKLERVKVAGYEL